jgi:hypothetical protein
VVDGANHMAGFRSLAWLLWKAPTIRRELVAAPGYVRHHLWYRWPLTVGLLSFWTDARSAYAYAHLPVHLSLWRRASRRDFTRGGWLAVYRFHNGGELWGDGVPAARQGFEHLIERPRRYRESPASPPEDR